MGLAAAVPKDWDISSVFFVDDDHLLALLLDRAGPRRPRPLPVAARGGFRHRRRAGRLLATAHHLPPPGAVVPEPHHRRDHAGAAGDHHLRDLAELPRAGHAPTGDLVGRHAAASLERADGGDLALAAAARRFRSSSPCSPSTSWAMGCATRPTRTGSSQCRWPRHAHAVAVRARPEDVLLLGRRRGPSRGRGQLRRLPGPDAGHRRRVRLRQERHRSLDPADRRGARPRRRRANPAPRRDASTDADRAIRGQPASAERIARCARSAPASSPTSSRSR